MKFIYIYYLWVATISIALGQFRTDIPTSTRPDILEDFSTESEDGVNWQRKDNKVGVDVSNEGWDSEMICYPAVSSTGGVFICFTMATVTAKPDLGWRYQNGLKYPNRNNHKKGQCEKQFIALNLIF